MNNLLLTAEALRNHQNLYAHAADNLETADQFRVIQVTQSYWPLLLNARCEDRVMLNVSEQSLSTIEDLSRGFELLGFRTLRETVSEPGHRNRRTYLIVSWGLAPSSVAPAQASAPAGASHSTPQMNLSAVDVTSVRQFRDSLLTICRNTRHLFDWDIPALHFRSTPGDELVPLLRDLAAGRFPSLTVDTSGLHIDGPDDAAVLMILPDLLRNEGCTVVVEGTHLHIKCPVKACR